MLPRRERKGNCSAAVGADNSSAMPSTRTSKLEVTLSATPFRRLRHWNATNRAQPCHEDLPFLRGTVCGLPATFPAVVATADLQGRTRLDDDPASLLGVTVAAELGNMSEAGLPPSRDCLGLLAGDFYCAPAAANRGGFGSVDLVFTRMAAATRALAGVAGNHDDLAPSSPGLLDGTEIEFEGMRIAGVSGIMGQSGRPRRHTPELYLGTVRRLLARAPHILVVHEAPEGPLAELLSATFSGLVVCGHRSWPERVRQLGRAVCLNAHGAVLVLEVKH